MGIMSLAWMKKQLDQGSALDPGLRFRSGQRLRLLRTPPYLPSAPSAAP